MPTTDFERTRTAGNHHVVCRRCGAIEGIDCTVDTTPYLTASNTAGFTIDEAEVVYRGVCPKCLAGTG